MAANQATERIVINKTPDVCGGDACIGNRRIPVWVIIGYRQLGRDDERLMKMFDPPITCADLEAVSEYYLQNRDEIDEAIQDNETGHDAEENLMTANQTIEKTTIKKTPGVCGGDACIGNRRLPVWQLVEAKRLGFTDQRLLERYLPPLTPADLEAAWSYFEDNRDEIEECIRLNNED